MMMRIFSFLFLFASLSLTPIAAHSQTDNIDPDVDGAESEEDAPPQILWEVCNETSFIQEIATVTIGDEEPGTPLTVKGWLRLYPGNCQEIQAKKGTPRFVYARSAPVHQGGIREWKGQHDYCVGEDDFEAKTDISCELQNMQLRKFLRVIPTEHRTAFVEPDNFGKKAAYAGLQRLLLDNNYDIRRVDGVSGRRTTNTLNKFLKDKELSTSINVEEKYAALETAALEIQSKIGVTVCNESSKTIWSAIASENEKELESRGWWPVEPQACIRPFTESLKDRQVHFYARQEADQQIDRVLKVASKSGVDLCIGEAKFSAIRQEFCEDQGYLTARFHTLPTDQTGARIILKDGNFGSAAISGLRQ